MKRLFRELAKKPYLQGDRLIVGVISIIAILLALLDFSFFDGRITSGVTNFNFILLGIFSVLIFFTVGIDTIKSFFLLSAGLSLIIFLAQSYCDTSIRTISGDSALKILIGLSFFYMTFTFLESIYKNLIRYWKFVKEEKDIFWSYFIFALLIVSAIFFIGCIYEVMRPILFNLCVYK